MPKIFVISLLTHFNSLLFQSFDAVIIISRFCSGHVTHCTYLIETLYFFHICRKSLKHQSVRFLELYKWKLFLRSLLCPVGLNGLNSFDYKERSNPADVFLEDLHYSWCVTRQKVMSERGVKVSNSWRGGKDEIKTVIRRVWRGKCSPVRATVLNAYMSHLHPSLHIYRRSSCLSLNVMGHSNRFFLQSAF